MGRDRRRKRKLLFFLLFSIPEIMDFFWITIVSDISASFQTTLKGVKYDQFISSRTFNFLRSGAEEKLWLGAGNCRKPLLLDTFSLVNFELLFDFTPEVEAKSWFRFKIRLTIKVYLFTGIMFSIRLNSVVVFVFFDGIQTGSRPMLSRSFQSFFCLFYPFRLFHSI